jgi:Domain of unknown function (DUF1877)
VGSLGAHFAVDSGMESHLLTSQSDVDLVGILEENEETCDLDFATDKAWDALHRCLSDGTLWSEGGAYPLSHVVLGGRQLHEGEERIVAYVSGDKVADIAAALVPVDRAWFRQ